MMDAPAIESRGGSEIVANLMMDMIPLVKSYKSFKEGNYWAAAGWAAFDAATIVVPVARAALLAKAASGVAIDAAATAAGSAARSGVKSAFEKELMSRTASAVAAQKAASLSGATVVLGDNSFGNLIASATSATSTATPAAAGGGTGWGLSFVMQQAKNTFTLGKADLATLYLRDATGVERNLAALRTALRGAAVYEFAPPVIKGGERDFTMVTQTIPEKEAASRDAVRADAHGKNYNMLRDTNYCNFSPREKGNFAASMERFGKKFVPPDCSPKQ